MRTTRPARRPRPRGSTPDKLRAARRFADPGTGYTEAELETLCAECETHGFGLGPTSIIRLLTVRPKRRRARLQRQAIQNGWSHSRLELEIAKEFGTRRAGGRRRRVPTEKTDLLVQLEQLCESWRRWRAALQRVPEGGGAAPERALPVGIRRCVNELGKGIDALHIKVEKELAREKPGRQTREDSLGHAASGR